MQAVVERELLLLQPAVRSDRRRVLSLLHPDFHEFGTSGRVWDRMSITGVTDTSTDVITATDVAARRLGPDAVLVTYRSHVGGRHALRSSVWVRTEGEWLVLFHQGTAATDAQPCGTCSGASLAGC